MICSWSKWVITAHFFRTRFSKNWCNMHTQICMAFDKYELNKVRAWLHLSTESLVFILFRKYLSHRRETCNWNILSLLIIQSLNNNIANSLEYLNVLMKEITWRTFCLKRNKYSYIIQVWHQEWDKVHRWYSSNHLHRGKF